MTYGGMMFRPEGFSYGPTILEATPNASTADGGALEFSMAMDSGRRPAPPSPPTCRSREGANRPRSRLSTGQHMECNRNQCEFRGTKFSRLLSVYLEYQQGTQTARCESFTHHCEVSRMDPITRDRTIQALREQLDLCRLQAASLDNDADRRTEMAQTSYAIQLLLDFLQRKEGG